MINEFGDQLLGEPQDQQPPAEVSPFGDRLAAPPKPSATANIINAQDTKPDEFANVQKVAQQVNLPPAVVGVDPKKYQEDLDRKQALDVIERNAAIHDWIGDNSTNAKVSHDDLPALEQFHNFVEALSPKNVWDKINVIGMLSKKNDPAFRAAHDDAVAAATAAWAQPKAFNLDDEPQFLRSIMMTPAIGLMLLAQRTGYAATHGAFAGFHTLVQQTLGPGDISGILSGEYVNIGGHFDTVPIKPAMQYAYMRARWGRVPPREGEIIPPDVRVTAQPKPPEPPTFDLGRGDYQDLKPFGMKNEAAAEPYVPPMNASTDIALRENEAPRPGTDWLGDQFHVGQHEADMTTFERALAAAQETKLRERSPEDFANFVQQAIGDRQLYIPGDVVAKLYASAEPHAADAVLGWMTNAESKISSSLTLGTDLSVPMAQALAHMDPAVWTAIKDSVRFSEVGLNSEEIKALKEAEPEDYHVDTRAPPESIQAIQDLAPEWLEDRGPQVPQRPESSEPVPFGTPSFHKVKVVSEFDKGRTLDLLGLSRYEKAHQMAAITVKELLQNAFDAIKDFKGAPIKGKINIFMDKGTRTVSVQDNGIGMDLDLMGRKFWEVAGTQKASSDNSGGFGISKMLWQHNNTGLRVYTLKNGVLTSIKTNGKAVRESFINPDAALELDTRVATAEDLKMFPDGHGTRVEVDIPAHFERNGMLRDFEFDDYLGSHPGLEHSPLFRDIEVKFGNPRYKNQDVDIGDKFPIKNFTQFMNVNFSWGKVRIYVTKSEKQQYGSNLHVLSNGIWQFSSRLANNPKDPWGDLIPREFYVDIKPDVKATDSEYPFDMNRQRFSKSTEEDFAKIYRYMQAKFRSVDLSTSARNFGDISELVEDPAIGGVREVNKRKLEPPVPPQQNVVTGISEGDTVEVKDGQLIVKGRAIPELTQQDLEDTHINLDELMVPQKEIDPNAVLLHDNIEIDSPAVSRLRKLRQTVDDEEQKISAEIMKLEDEGKKVPRELTTRYDTLVNQAHQVQRQLAKQAEGRVSLVDAARAQFGGRFNEYAHYIGKVFQDLRDFVAEELDYPALKNEGIGISFDQKYYGVSIRIPFSGTFINIAIAAERGPRRVALDMIHTMIHELAHHKVREHDAKFADEMQKIKVYVEEARLYNSEKYDIGNTARGMIKHLEDNFDIFTWLSQQIATGAPSTRGKRLKGAESSVGGGGLPGDADKTGGLERPTDVGAAEGGGAGGAGTDVDKGGPEGDLDLFESPDEYKQRVEEERNAVETELSLATRRERRALYLAPLFKDPKSAGMDAVQFGRYSRKIAEADQAAYEKAIEKAKALVKKRLTEEWKRDREQIKSEVETDLRSTPMFVADRYIRLGELPTGEIVERQKLDAAAVGQLGGKGLDRYMKKDGLHPDDIAPFLGFQSGQQLVDALNKLEQGRKAWNPEKGPKAYQDHLVNTETDERMERRYGSLQANILDEARDLATTANYLDILTDELKQLAQLEGLPFDKNSIPTSVSADFQTEIASESTYEKFRKAAEQNAKAAEKALLSSKYREAFQAKLRQYGNVLMAKEAKAFQKKVNTAERKFNRIARQETKGGVDQNYYDNMRLILRDVGYKPNIDVQTPDKNLTQLISESGAQLAIADWIANPGTIVGRIAKKYNELTVEEFNGLNNSLRSLEHVGGEVKSINSVHGRANLDNFVVDATRSMERFGMQTPKEKQGLVRRAGGLIQYVAAAHTLVERVFDYVDKFDPNGPITRYVDRPLRDSYSRELELIEQVVKRLRDLEQYTDPSVNDLIDNQTIIDPLDKKPHPMNRKNLRMLMLHMGSASGAEKVTKGYNITYEQAYDLIRNNAKKKDFDWVNGMHELFDFLWKPASEMQRRYTGVESDPIEAKPYTMMLRDGTNFPVTSNGGYAPVFYDKTRTNIENELSLKNNLFDPHYVAAIPAHGYTLPRTKYSGWIDMDGTLLASKIYQMVHDIAFREAVRNTQKVLADQVFMLNANRYLGPNLAALFSGWLRDIANIHNVDDAFAQGFARFLATTRNNITNTLIAFNPGTVMKHGLTALAMSKGVSSLGPLGGAIKDLGLKAIAESMKDLMTKQKIFLTPEERSAVIASLRDASTREFIINSSPLFRNRSRSYPDTIRGAFERASEAGPLQTMRNLQSISDRAGRFAVALSDMVSAMPVWLATYKTAMARDGDHDDAVFEADRVTARAHGSAFYGDKPAVMRLGTGALGQLGKYFVSLYNFWNHMGNNVLQLAWDIEQRSRRGAGSEPGADWGKIMERIFLYAIIPIVIEEIARPAFDKKKEESWGQAMMNATLRYFGSFTPFTRDITNGFFNGYEPSVGLLGTGFKAVYDVLRDIKKPSRSAVTHAFTFLGFAGVPFASQQAGRSVQGAFNQMTGRERPRSLEEFRALYRKGYIHPRR